MKENDYYGHYKAFVKELSLDPDQTLQIYCRENGVVWRRLYDWMRRHHISLKRLYQTYRSKSEDAVPAIGSPDGIDFRELIPRESKDGRMPLPEDGTAIKGVRINLPSQISSTLGECSAAVLSRLIAVLAGKEVADVLA